MYTARGTLDQQSAVVEYGPMVRRVAAQMIAKLPANVELDDLVQAGMIGLIDALSRYQADQGAQFETFAMQRVRGAMLDELRGADWMPRSVRRNQRAIEAAIRKAEQRHKRTPGEREVAAELGLSVEDYQKMLGEARGAQLVYLDDFGEGGEDGFLDRYQPESSSDVDPGAMLRDERFRDALIGAIEELPEREKLVMGMYYEQEMNLKEIGAVLGVTESRISQLHSQAVARLRVKLRSWS
ncbi:MAG: RNA polymerase sigma factor FliA [Burkholderiaceae bacterium]|nr:RNA polymerase sigma factor FliA [Burkholderiaceae bacterium]